MRYWRINSLCKVGAHEWVKSRIMGEIEQHLWKREYRSADVSEQGLMKAPDNMIYKLSKVWQADGDVFSIFIYDESNTEDSGNRRTPQIVTLVEDFFKINRGIWYYLETLNKEEDIQISKTNRLIEPLMIKKCVEDWSESGPPPKPEVLEIGDYKYQETDIYWGTKNQFHSLLDFWISCLYWVSYGEFDAIDLNDFNVQAFYDLSLGSCIPVDVEGIEEICKDVSLKDERLINPVNAYLMRKDWNDRMYVLEYESNYVMHNWHTAE